MSPCPQGTLRVNEVKGLLIVPVTHRVAFGCETGANGGKVQLQRTKSRCNAPRTETGANGGMLRQAQRPVLS